MMLYVENQRLDVMSDLSAAITYAIDDIRDFAAKNSSYSKTMVLPGSARNNKVLGMIFEVTQSNPFDPDTRNILTNFNAAKRADAIIFIDNLQVFKGTFRLLKVIDDNGRIEYECAVFGELGGFVASLGAKKLEDIDFSDYDHTFDVANVVSSWSTINGKGYYYPFIDYANMSTNKVDWDIKTFRPALYVKEYIDRIFADAGYRLSSKILDTNRFRKLIVTSTRKESADTYVSKSYDGYFEKNYYYPYVTSKLVLGYSPATNFFQMESGTDLRWVVGNGYTINNSISTVLTFSGNTPPDGPVVIVMSLKKNGTTISSTSAVVPVGSTYYKAKLTINFTTTADANDIFNLSILTTTSGTVGSTSFLLYAEDGFWSILNDPAFNYAGSYGSVISMNQSTPRNYLQLDFISSIAKLFNLLIYEDPDQDKLLKIDPYVEFYDLGGGVRLIDNGDDGIIEINDSGDGILLDDGEVNAVDWSYKLNRARPVEIIPLSELNARYYDFAYKEDSDYWNQEYKKKHNELYGSRRYDSEFDFSKDIEKVEVIFASTPLVQYDDKIMPAIFQGTPITDEKPFEGSIRILQANRLICNAYDIKNGSTVLSTQSTYGYAGHFDIPTAPTADLNFGSTKELFYPGLSTSSNQFNVYWSPYMAEITDKDSRLLVGWFMLNEEDIHSLDFSKFIWVDGNMYRLNKIEDWNASYPDECRVSLLKVIQTVF